MTTERDLDDDTPDPALFWRWVGKATRPVVGWALLGFAALLVLLGWFGVSREAIVAKQIPYVVSGGIAGVLLAVIGAYFLGTEELRKDSGRLDRLERMVAELHRALLEQPASGDVVQMPLAPPEAVDAADAVPPAPHDDEADAADAAAGGTPAPAVSNGRSSIVALAGSDLYHRSGCSMVAGKRAAALVPSTVRKRNLQPCPLCEPAVSV